MAGLDRVFPVYCSNLYGGPGYIAGEPPDGLVRVNGVPAAREIRVSDRVTSRLVAVAWSATDGTYSVNGLNPEMEFDVSVRDWARQWNDRVRQGVTPKAY